MRAVRMWLNNKQIIHSTIPTYRASLLRTCPNHIVIDNLFDEEKLDEVMDILQKDENWRPQKHTYSALYVNRAQWKNASKEQRFVQRDVWQRNQRSSITVNFNFAQEFLLFLRGDEFMSLLSGIFNTTLTDINVIKPEKNTNYFRLSTSDFVGQHADDSPGRVVCMLLYLNKEWHDDAGGELVFLGKNDKPIRIAPSYNRCVLFDPSSGGAEHWVERLNPTYADNYRYNVTSWYWSE